MLRKVSLGKQMSVPPLLAGLGFLVILTAVITMERRNTVLLGQIEHTYVGSLKLSRDLQQKCLRHVSAGNGDELARIDAFGFQRPMQPS